MIPEALTAGAIALVPLLGACDPPAGCSKDTDCKGDRICQSGHCVAPSGTPGAANAGPKPTAPPVPAAQEKACGHAAELSPYLSITKCVKELSEVRTTNPDNYKIVVDCFANTKDMTGVGQCDRVLWCAHKGPVVPFNTKDYPEDESGYSMSFGDPKYCPKVTR
jgi:hypothetical protein